MDFATRFVVKLKSYFDAIPLNVWTDFERNLLPGRKWDEDSILRTSILRDGFDKTDRLRDANNNPVYRLDIELEDYGGGLEETLTGADLALIFRFEINRSLLGQRLILVQLKRANFDNRTTGFPALHHRSGAKYYGRDLHQAQKMLLFSSTPVYWFAMTSGILEDEPSLAAYSERSSLATKRELPMRSGSDAESTYGLQDPLFALLPGLPLTSLASLSPGELERLLVDVYDEIYHYPPFRYFLRHVRGMDPSALARNLKYASDNEPYQLWRQLRGRLQEYANDNFGMPQRIGLFVCSAEDVYALSHTGRHSFLDVYPKSIPFTQFMLSNVLSEGFGDTNEDLIDAVQQQDIRGYFRDRLQYIAEAYGYRISGDVADLLPVHQAITLRFQVNTAVSQG